MDDAVRRDRPRPIDGRGESGREQSEGRSADQCRNRAAAVRQIHCRGPGRHPRSEMTARGEGDKVPKKAPPKPKSPQKRNNPRKPKPKQQKPPGTPPKATKPPAVAPAAVATATRPAEVKQSQPAQPTATAATGSASTARSLLDAAPSAKSTYTAPESSPAAPAAPAAKYKVCSHCGFRLPESYKVGDDCPNCGAHFSYEETDQGATPRGLRPSGDAGSAGLSVVVRRYRSDLFSTRLVHAAELIVTRRK